MPFPSNNRPILTERLASSGCIMQSEGNPELIKGAASVADPVSISDRAPTVLHNSAAAKYIDLVSSAIRTV